MIDDKYIPNRRKNRPRTLGKRDEPKPVHFSIPDNEHEESLLDEKKAKLYTGSSPREKKFEPEPSVKSEENAPTSPLEVGKIYTPKINDKRLSEEEAAKKLTASLKFEGETLDDTKTQTPKMYEPEIDLSIKHDPFKESLKGEVSPLDAIFGGREKKERQITNKIKKRFGGGLKSIFFNLFLFLVFFTLSWSISNAPSLISNLSYDAKSADVLGSSKVVNAGTPTGSLNYVGGPDKLIVPSLGIDAPLVLSDQTSEKGILKDLESGVVHYGNTPLPGQAGNSVFFGHSSNFIWAPGNYKQVFALLSKLKVGDEITIHYAGKEYVYRVTKVSAVDPSEIQYLKSDSATPKITLITCTPTGTTWKRLVVEAEQISPAPENKKSDKAHLPSL